jgi:histidinol phosphatase-like enzyme (inositol monophosphatase family)
LDVKLQQELRSFISELVVVAATHAVPYFRTELTVDNKGGARFDPVTVADRDTEDALRAAIAQRFPDHGISGEERTPVNPTAQFQWVLDPIDGTKAFLCGLPTWSTLIAFCEYGVPVLGIMSQPIVGEYFIGGFGASEQVNAAGRKNLRTSRTSLVRDASVFATSPTMFSSSELLQFENLARASRLTRFGVDSYAYCMLAAGFIDIVAEADLGFYDLAALVPIIECAGGVISDWKGAQVRGGGTVLAASNADLHKAALGLINGV